MHVIIMCLSEIFDANFDLIHPSGLLQLSAMPATVYPAWRGHVDVSLQVLGSEAVPGRAGWPSANR